MQVRAKHLAECFGDADDILLMIFCRIAVSADHYAAMKQ